MAETIDGTSSLESTTVGVYRTAATVKGGRRFSFSALVVVGDRQGSVGFGYGKANQVPPAIEKAQKQAKRNMRQFPMIGRTIPHEVTGRFGACHVRLLPASPGTGVIAGAAVRAPLEMMGAQDCLTKSFGSNNSKNLVKAVVNGLEQLRSKEMVESLRGQQLGKTQIEESIERAHSFGDSADAATATAGESESGAAAGNGESKSRRGNAQPPDRKKGQQQKKGKTNKPQGTPKQTADSDAAAAPSEAPTSDEASSGQPKQEGSSN